MDLTVSVIVSKQIGEAVTTRETSATVTGLTELIDVKGAISIVLCRVAQNAEGDNNAN